MAKELSNQNLSKEACTNSRQQVAGHFEDILEMVTIGYGAQRKTIEDIGGEMPEKLPVADNIKKIEKARQPKQITDKNDDL